MLEKLEAAIKISFKELVVEDGELFNLKVNEENEKNGRKLHEVCINSKLAIHLSRNIIPILEERECFYYTDIEFNRNGEREKAVIIDRAEQVVRPDIIIHNRKYDDNKSNFLVVECKKAGLTAKEHKDDISKITGLMYSEDYQYEYGLMVIYKYESVESDFFWFEKGIIKSKKIIC